MKLKSLFILFTISSNLLGENLPQYYCTAANQEYYNHLINLIGSIHKTNFNELKEIAVFDLGLTNEQKSNLKKIQKLKIYNIERTNPNLLTPYHTGYKFVPGWYAWKPVVIKQSLDMFPYVLWIDAGSTVINPLNDLFRHIKENGHFLCTIGSAIYHPIGYPVAWGTTKYVKDKFKLDNKPWFNTKESVMGGIIGVSKKVQSNFVLPLYELTKDLRNFQDDGTAPNGFGCCRHDQTLIGMIAYSLDLKVFKQDPTQATPMNISLDSEIIPLNITWDKGCVNDKTHIFSSRNNLNLEHYKTFIKYI